MSEDQDASARTAQDGAKSVSEYRLGQVEREVKDLEKQVDGFDLRYLSRDTLNLIIDPWKEAVREIQAERKNEIHLKSQLKIAIAVAFVSPVLTVAINYLFRVS